MKCNGQINFNPVDEEDLELIGTCDDIFLQDAIHIGTKLRNRLLKASILLPFGNEIISVAHLKMLLLNVPKDIHGLVTTDILPEDRQNFHSLEKIMDSPVLEALHKYVIDSEATVVYLNLCKNVTSCCLDKQLSPLVRIFRIWNSVFILRIWRDFLKAANYSVNDNFISQNAYDCIEVNAICLIRLIMNLRNNGITDMFKPYMFDSQPCERTFRQMRSMTTMNWTRINFGILELLNLIERTELQNDIIYHRLINIIKFPRVAVDQSTPESTCQSRDQCDNKHELPSNENILATIRKALDAAVETTSKFGMACDLLNVVGCRSKKPRVPRHQNLTDPELSAELIYNESSDEEDNCDDSSIENRMEHLNLRSYNDVAASVSIDENSKFIEVCQPDGTNKIVLKSSIVWLLTNSTEKLSSDRLKRVQGTHPHKLENIKRSRQDPRLNCNLSIPDEHIFFKSDKIYIGDWCVFGFDRDSNPNTCIPEENAIENILVGSIIAFKYTLGSTEKEKQYHLEFVNVVKDLVKDNQTLDQTFDVTTEQPYLQRDDVEVLAAWYTFDNNGILISLGTNRCFFVNMKKYISTTTAPIKGKVNDKNILSFIGNIAEIIKSICDLVE